MTQIALLLYVKKKEFHGFIFAYGKLNVVCCLPEIYLKKNGAVLILSLNFDSVTENKKTANQYLNFG